MAPQDATEFATLAVRVGLVEDHVAKECLYEIEERTAPALARYMERKGLITPLQTSRLMKGEVDGYILGGYRLLYKIASGSFGRVYRGSDPATGQTVAIKVLRKKWTDDKRRVELFEREGRLGLSIQHPNIVQILAVNRDNNTGQYFIVMEFVEGGNLRDILSIRKKLDLDEALRILEECATALTYASSRGLTHRDIKPTNILISTDKTAKLVDFGLAEMSAGPQAMSSAAVNREKEDAEVDRTVDYAGLERVTGLKKGDPRSDIFFLGTVFFEMLTGHAVLPPTKDRNASMLRQRFEVDETIRRLGPEYGLPGSVTALAAKMCAFDPNQRFQTPALMLDAVKAIRAELAGGTAALSHQASGPLTLFVVEANAKLQDVFRDKFKKLGFRVLISIDANQAVKRYQQQPYHAALIDVGSIGREGADAFNRLQREAQIAGLEFTAIIVFNEDESAWAEQMQPRPGGHVFVRPVTMKQLTRTLREGVGLEVETEPDAAAD